MWRYLPNPSTECTWALLILPLSLRSRSPHWSRLIVRPAAVGGEAVSCLVLSNPGCATSSLILSIYIVDSARLAAGLFGRIFSAVMAQKGKERLANRAKSDCRGICEAVVKQQSVIVCENVGKSGVY